MFEDALVEKFSNSPKNWATSDKDFFVQPHFYFMVPISYSLSKKGKIIEFPSDLPSCWLQ